VLAIFAVFFVGLGFSLWVAWQILRALPWKVSLWGLLLVAWLGVEFVSLIGPAAAFWIPERVLLLSLLVLPFYWMVLSLLKYNRRP
jgi:hypothetical protein